NSEGVETTNDSGTGFARSVPAPPPQLETALLAAPETGDVRAVEEDDAEPRRPAERDHRPRVAEKPRPEGEGGGRRHRGDRRVARQREDEDPDPGAGRSHERRHAEERA